PMATRTRPVAPLRAVTWICAATRAEPTGLGVCRFVAVQGATPSRPQDARPLGVALVEEACRGHPVRPEASEVLAQLAPGDQVTDGLHVADRHRPDDALALAALLLAVAQRAIS